MTNLKGSLLKSSFTFFIILFSYLSYGDYGVEVYKKSLGKNISCTITAKNIGHKFLSPQLTLTTSVETLAASSHQTHQPLKLLYKSHMKRVKEIFKSPVFMETQGKNFDAHKENFFITIDLITLHNISGELTENGKKTYYLKKNFEIQYWGPENILDSEGHKFSDTHIQRIYLQGVLKNFKKMGFVKK